MTMSSTDDTLEKIFLSDRQRRSGAPALWTIYDHPKDHPDFFVARRYLGETPSTVTLAHTEIEQLRELFRLQGMICMPRDPSDDPVIVETWI